jgi:hypothetical protein
MQRWEIYISYNEYPDFCKFVNCNGGGCKLESINDRKDPNLRWTVVHIPDDLRVLAKLKFSITEVEDQLGLDCLLSYCPSI